MNFSSFIKTTTAAVLFTVAVTGTVYATTSNMKAWQIAVAKEVAKKQRYPRAAQVREIEGTAKVRLVVAADGTIKSHKVLQATGKEVLDNEIPKLIERLNPLPSLPSGKAELSMVLPLNWTLN